MHEVQFFDRGKKGAEITRVQFPLTLACARIEIVVNMKGGRFIVLDKCM